MKHFWVVFVTVLQLSCSSESDSSPTSDLKVALVTDFGKIDDGTFNQSAYEGGLQAAQAFGLQFDYREPASTDDYSTEVEYFVDQDYDMVITVGFQMTDVTLESAQSFPDTKFVIVDVTYDDYPDNLVGLSFAEDEAGYLAGSLAAMVSESKSLGVIGGIALPPVKSFVNGFINGALAECETCSIACTYISSFTDPDTGAAQASSMISNQNADVIFGAGGATGSGAILETTKSNKWAIGVDTDEYYTTYQSGAEASSTYLLSSAVKKIDVAVYEQIEALVNGNFVAGSIDFDASNNGIGLSDYHSTAVTTTIQTSISEILSGLGDGTISTNVNESTGDSETSNSVTCSEVQGS
ncbi:BMP family ABC transporter substrate-binding protein [Pseudobacteriovorax antillogorgiicola]|uniref:Nucleoside-binding protein n=1 Tax=Pseudobacteriovorax antillogorgiicola TaxID=1513793 RepID=A0A1Y6BPT3_9BACT|nr:BMP family ABC transporter substrate-binding protein [Pseudobacteriovorax antillogorgiicola]TCS54489.1 nucleoside-binding protein [Pseudobacteriovorax antillogorgiicola]SMF19121.1 nucleoside-binding protein [Pseudobacteriovorax antillogorgiicola]